MVALLLCKGKGARCGEDGEDEIAGEAKAEGGGTAEGEFYTGSMTRRNIEEHIRGTFFLFPLLACFVACFVIHPRLSLYFSSHTFVLYSGGCL